ncbi:TIR domain-containing protein [Desulfobacter curvatus]|uniref:TIR domain-containing protein n=1 Tax=Desulfobacter curvatus TaxID=2290 RepID=UPI0012FB55C9|nr:TIR domain-containing protein [Desulfobacter curvatus]
MDEAILLLNVAVSLGPNNADAYNELGFCHYRKGVFQKAEAAAEQAVAQAPGNPKFRSALLAARLARAESETSRLAIADSAFMAQEEAMILADLHPDYPPVYIAWARLLALCGEPIHCWEKKLHEAQTAYETTDWMACKIKKTSTLVKGALSGASQACRQAHMHWSSAYNNLGFPTAAEYWVATALPTRVGPYDIFVSYASQDAEVARHVVDFLIANGICVWFAEYQVLLSARPAWEEYVRYGISHSKHGLVLCGPEYFNKEPCRLERMMLEKRSGKDKLFSVSIVDLEPTSGSYAKSECRSQNTYDFTSVLHNTLESLGIHPTSQNLELFNSASIPENAWNEADGSFVCLGIQGKLEAVNWRRTSEIEGASNILTEGALLKLCLSHVEAGLRVEVTASWASERDSFRPFGQDFDDAINYARDPARGLLSSIRGVHILECQGRPRVAITCKVGTEWCRTVWVHFPSPDNTSEAIILFEFVFKTPGTFSEYCSYSRTMDLLVKSLRWPVLHESITSKVINSISIDKQDSQKRELPSGYAVLNNATVSEIGYLAHYVAAWQALGRKTVSLEIELNQLTLEVFGLRLAYSWKECLSTTDADQMDTRLRAFVNCIVGSTAEAAGLCCRATKSPGKLRSVPVAIPGWHLEGFPLMPVHVIASRFNVADQLVHIDVGIAFTVGLPNVPPGAERLLRQFRNQWRRLVV